MSHEQEFFIDGMPVGYFEETEMPRVAGRFRYMPYRGAGHYEMQTLRKAGDCPRCYYDAGDSRVSFVVRDCPDYGVLELDDFETSPRSAS